MDALRRPWPDGITMSKAFLAERNDLPNVSAWALSLVIDGKDIDPQFMDVLYICPDGSGVSGGTWGVDIIAKLVTGYVAFLTAMAGKVITDPDARGFIGASAEISATAKYSAMAWAAAWVLQKSFPCLVSVVFEPDNTSAGNLSAGTWLPKVNQRLVSCMRCLYALVVRRHTTSWSHVKGHAHHPWNSLADYLAGAAASGGLPLVSIQLPIVSWSTGSSSEPDWQIFVDQNRRHSDIAYPSIDEFGNFRLEPPTLLLHSHDVVGPKPKMARPSSKRRRKAKQR